MAVARKPNRRGNAWFVQGNAEHLPLTNAWPAPVTCFEGIERFCDAEAHLGESCAF